MKIFYQGVHTQDPETTDAFHTRNSGTEWKSPRDISACNLDTRHGHLIHIVEQRREIQVVIFTANGEEKKPFQNNATLQDVLDWE